MSFAGSHGIFEVFLDEVIYQNTPSCEVGIEVWPSLVGGRFVITFFNCVGEDSCFCDYYFSNAD